MMSNVPKLRFTEFSGEWEEKKLVQVIDFKSGYAFSSSDMSNEPQKYQLIKMSNVYQNVLDLDRSPSYWKDINKAHSEFLLEVGDVLLTLTGTVGKRDYGYSVMIKENNKFLLNQRLVRLRAKEKLSNSRFIRNLVLNERFLYYFFINSKGGTGNQSNVSIEDLKQIKLPFPSKQEQEKIASFLISVDTKIEQLTKKEELLSSYKKGVMQKIFSGEIRFKADDGSEFCEWEEKKLGNLCSITTGKLDANAMVENGQYRFYTCAKDYFLIDNYAFDTDALLISGNGANVGYIHHYNGKFNAYQRTYVLDGFKDNIFFLKYVLDKYLYKRIMKEKNEGNTPYIVMGTLADMFINIPCLSEQTKIANFLSSIDSKIEQVQKQLNSTKEFKKALLQQMFV